MANRVHSLVQVLLIIWVVVVHGTENSTTIEAEIECPFKKGFMANPKSHCDHIFYICYDSVGYLQNCPVNLYFDTDLNECDVWFNVAACSGIARTTLLAGNTTDQPREMSTFDPEIFDCKKKQNGNYPDIHAKTANCSNRYFTCDLGKVVVYTCPNGFYYDPDHNWCDIYRNVFACAGKTRRPEKLTSPKPHVEVDFDCMGKVDDIYPDPHRNCTHYYFICVAGTAYIIDCPENTYYNHETNACERREDTFGCTGVHKTTPGSTSTMFPSISYTFSCKNKTDNLYGDPDQPCSTHYFSCFSGHTYLMYCPAKLYFDDKLKDCAYKKDIEACAKETTTNSSTTITSETKSSLVFGTPSVNGSTTEESILATNSTEMNSLSTTIDNNATMQPSSSMGSDISLNKTTLSIVDSMSSTVSLNDDTTKMLLNATSKEDRIERATTLEPSKNESTSSPSTSNTLEPLHVMTLP